MQWEKKTDKIKKKTGFKMKGEHTRDALNEMKPNVSAFYRIQTIKFKKFSFC